MFNSLVILSPAPYLVVFRLIKRFKIKLVIIQSVVVPISSTSVNVRDLYINNLFEIFDTYGYYKGRVLRLRILQYVYRHRLVSAPEVYRALKISRQCFYYHLNILERLGLVKTRRHRLGSIVAITKYGALVYEMCCCNGGSYVSPRLFSGKPSSRVLSKFVFSKINCNGEYMWGEVGFRVSARRFDSVRVAFTHNFMGSIPHIQFYRSKDGSYHLDIRINHVRSLSEVRDFGLGYAYRELRTLLAFLLMVLKGLGLREKDVLRLYRSVPGVLVRVEV